MERVYLGDIRNHLNEEVLVQGFVENFRNSRAMAFIVLKDITGKLQITIEKEKLPEVAASIEGLTGDSVISVVGTAFESEYVKLNGLEMFPKEIRIESLAAALPIQREEIPATKKRPGVPRSGVDDRLDYRWIDLRTDKNQFLFRLQTEVTRAMRDFALDRNFIEVHTPKLIATASESGSNVFEVDYFDRKAYLAQSPQFYKQMAMAAGFDRYFEVGPVFRAEKSFTAKHATEFTCFDIEFSYINSFEDVMKFEEELLTDMLRKVKEKCGEKLEELFGMEIIVPETPFPRVKLADLYKGLEEDFGFTVPESEKGDLTTEAERLSYGPLRENKKNNRINI